MNNSCTECESLVESQRLHRVSISKATLFWGPSRLEKPLQFCKKILTQYLFLSVVKQLERLLTAKKAVLAFGGNCLCAFEKAFS